MWGMELRWLVRFLFKPRPTEGPEISFKWGRSPLAYLHKVDCRNYIRIWGKVCSQAHWKLHPWVVLCPESLVLQNMTLIHHPQSSKDSLPWVRATYENNRISPYIHSTVWSPRGSAWISIVKVPCGQSVLFKWERTDNGSRLLQNSFLLVQTWLRLVSFSRKMTAEVVVVVPFITGSVTEQTGSSRPFSGRRVENSLFAIVHLLLSMSDSHILSMRPHGRLWLWAVSVILFVLTC